MHELALFAGGGLGLLGSRLLGWRTVCYVENNPYCVEILKARIKDGYLDDSPIWDDVRTFDGRPWAGHVDIVTAGFPCQPWSEAGKRQGEKDRRNLWPDTFRILTEVRPEWVLLENVPRLLNFAYVQKIFGDLARSGFSCRWDLIPAAAAGAPHLRYRLWIVAHSVGERHESDPTADRWAAAALLLPHSYSCNPVWRRIAEQVGRGKRQEGPGLPGDPRRAVWSPQPRVGRVAYGVPHRVERLNALGNGQVPPVVPLVWELLA